jgi:hypothetical protein
VLELLAVVTEWLLEQKGCLLAAGKVMLVFVCVVGLVELLATLESC